MNRKILDFTGIILKIASSLRFYCVRIAGSQIEVQLSVLILQCYLDVVIGPYAQVKRVSIYGGK